MSWYECKSCGSQVSLDTVICPHCGKGKPARLGSTGQGFVMFFLKFFFKLFWLSLILIPRIVLTGIVLILSLVVYVITFGRYSLMEWSDQVWDFRNWVWW